MMLLTNPLLRSKDLTWNTMRALHELRHLGNTKRSVLRGNAYMQDLLNRGLIRLKRGSKRIVETIPGAGFEHEYDTDLASAFDQANDFLETHLLLTPHLNHTLAQIEGLTQIYANAQVITRAELSRSELSNRHMGGSKVFRNHPALYRDALKLLGLGALPTSDHISQTAVYMTGAMRARIIVLCENEAYLKQPAKAQQLGVELLNAGGRNVGKLEHYFIPPLGVELYYACDWDYAGLTIFRTIAAGYRRQKRDIQLLTPVADAARRPVDSTDHFSQWSNRLWDDDLEPDAPVDQVFSEPQRALIRDLMARNEWIEEEGSELRALLQANGVV